MINFEENQPPEIKPEILQIIEIAEKIIQDEYGQNLPEETLDPTKTFSGPILDENDESLTEIEISFLTSWIEKKLGTKPNETPIKAKFKSPDGITEVTVYDVELGNKNFAGTKTEAFIRQRPHRGFDQNF